ncbi:14459_t:CDS:2, partial [Racocetra fulgida]
QERGMKIDNDGRSIVEIESGENEIDNSKDKEMRDSRNRGKRHYNAIGSKRPDEKEEGKEKKKRGERDNNERQHQEKKIKIKETTITKRE